MGINSSWLELKVQRSVSNLYIAIILEGFLTETPYLIHDTTKAPHITGSGVLFEVYCLLVHKDKAKK